MHCSATREGLPVNVDDIRRWHVDENGWQDIGYHYVIHLDGSIHAGRPEEVAGAHCNGYNRTSIGVCYVGGIASDGKTPKDTRTNAQTTSMVNLLRRLKVKYPNATVCGHNELARKACPSFDVRKWLSDIGFRN